MVDSGSDQTATLRNEGWSTGPNLHSRMAYGFRPAVSVLRHLTYRRRGTRRHDPADVLLPDGYVAEVVATGFTTPVHCSFGPDGACYVTECGYKTEVPPSILRVNVTTGSVEVSYRLPGSKWRDTGALTGGCWHEGWFSVGKLTPPRLELGGRIS